jgi:hypothetical protein
LHLSGAFHDHLFEMLTIVFDLLFEMPLMQGALKACQYGAFLKRLNKIVIRARTHCLHAYIHVIDARGHQERHIGIMAASFDQKLHAANSRHAKVGDDGIESLALQGHEGFFAAVGRRTREISLA